MAYTLAQLTTFFTNANATTAPTAAQTTGLQGIANQNATGALTDAQALQAAIDMASDVTTAVSVQTYQFFLGFAPSVAGLAALNAAFVGSGAQANLNGENRFIAQSVALALQNTTAKATFTSNYGSLSIVDATKAAYNVIVGNTAAAAAGINIDNAVAFLTSEASVAYYTAFVKANVPGLAEADVTLAVKAALVGEIIYQATIFNNGAGVGSYATAANNLIKDLADDGALTANNVNGIDLFASYGAAPVAVTTALTTGVDAIVGTAAADTITGSGTTLTNLDSIDGGAGNDTLKISAVAALDVTALVGLTVKNVETVDFTAAGALTLNTKDFSGTTSVVATSIGGAVITGGSAQALTVTEAKTDASTVTVNGGSSVTVTSAATGAISVGATTQQTGATTVTASNGAAVTVQGGTSVTVTETGNGAVTIGNAKAVSGAVSVTSTGTGNVAIDGGTSVTVASSGQGAGTITIGANTAPTGAVSVTNAGGYVDGANLTLGNVAVTGGSTVTVNQSAGFTSTLTTAAAKDTSNFTLTQAATTVTGKDTTTEVTVKQAAAVTAVNAVAAVAETGKITESAVVTFTALTAGQTLIVGGLTFTAGGAGLTAAQTATVFADLKAGATTGYATALGAYTGTFAGFNTGSVATGNKVTFTSTTADTDVADVAFTGTGAAAATAVITQGAASNAVSAVTGVLGVAGNTVTINDVNAASTTKAGTITTATIENATTVAINDNSLSTLNLSGKNGNVTITANATAISSGVAATTLGVNVAGTVGTLTGSQYKTINVTSSADTTFTGITSTAATALSVAGSGAVKLGTLTTAALTKLTATGSVSVTADVSGIGTVTSVDTSGTSGNSTITLDATKATFTGGAGNDVVTIAAAPTKAIAGGMGADTLVVNATAAVFGNPSANTNVTGFETLALGTAADGSYNATGFTGLSIANAVANAVTFTNVAAGAGLTISGAPGQNVAVTLADATGTSDSFALTLSSSAALAAGQLTLAGIETISINAVDTNSTAHVDTLTLVATSAKSLTVTGSAGLNLTNTGNTALATFDASASTGAITFATAVTTGTTTITGSATKANTLTGGTAADTIVGGSAADTLTSGTGLDILTGGAGNDTFVLAANANGNTYATITDFAKGDTITVTALKENGTANFALGSKVALADTAAFADYLNAAASGDGGTNTIVKWFQFGGNTYIVFDNDAANTFQNGATADQVVKLTGLIDLSTAVTQVGGTSAISII